MAPSTKVLISYGYRSQKAQNKFGHFFFSFSFIMFGMVYYFLKNAESFGPTQVLSCKSLLSFSREKFIMKMISRKNFLLLLFTFLLAFDFRGVEIGIIFLFFTFLAIFLLLVFIIKLVFFESFSGEEEHSPWDNSIPDVVANFEICRQQILSFWINISIGIIRDWWWVKEIKKAVIFDLFGDCSNIAFALMFLLLFHGFHSEIFALFPVDCITFTFENFWTFKAKGVVLTGLTFHFVFLGEDQI